MCDLYCGWIAYLALFSLPVLSCMSNTSSFQRIHLFSTHVYVSKREINNEIASRNAEEHFKSQLKRSNIRFARVSRPISITNCKITIQIEILILRYMLSLIVYVQSQLQPCLINICNSNESV